MTGVEQRGPEPKPDVDWAAVHRRVRSWLSRRAPAGVVDDLAQETLLRVHRTLPAGIRSPEAWALRVAHSTLVDHFRAAARGTETATDPFVLAALAPHAPDDGAGRPDAVLGEEADRALDVAIARCIGPGIDALPTEQREAITLTSVGALTQADAADAAGISVPGMKSRVQRGRLAVRARVESCCRFELDGRGRPIGMQPRTPGACTCGCATSPPPG